MNGSNRAALALIAAVCCGLHVVPAQAGERGRLTESRTRAEDVVKTESAAPTVPEAGSPQAAPAAKVEQNGILPPALENLDISGSDLPGARPPQPAEPKPAPVETAVAPPPPAAPADSQPVAATPEPVPSPADDGMAAAALRALSGAALPPAAPATAAPATEPKATAPVVLPPEKPAAIAAKPEPAPAAPPAAIAVPEKPPVQPASEPAAIAKSDTAAKPADVKPAASKPADPKPAAAATDKPRTSDDALKDILARSPPHKDGPIEITVPANQDGHGNTPEHAVQTAPSKPRPNPALESTAGKAPAPILAPSLPLRFGGDDIKPVGVPVLKPSAPAAVRSPPARPTPDRPASITHAVAPPQPAAPPALSGGGCPLPGQGDEATRFACLQQQASAGQAIAQMMQASNGNAAAQAAISDCLNRYTGDLNAALSCARNGGAPPPAVPPVGMNASAMGGGQYVAPGQEIDPALLARMGVPALPGNDMPSQTYQAPQLAPMQAQPAYPAGYPGYAMPPLSATAGSSLPTSPFAAPNAAGDLRSQLQQLCAARWPGRYDQQATCMNDMLAASQRLLGFSQQYPAGSRGGAILAACRTQWGIQLDLATQCVDQQIQNLLKGG